MLRQPQEPPHVVGQDLYDRVVYGGDAVLSELFGLETPH
jgi:hypothetical protein